MRVAVGALTPPHAPQSAAARKMKKKRTQRATSNVFAMFDQEQIKEFKEAFDFIDQVRRGKRAPATRRHRLLLTARARCDDAEPRRFH